MVQRESAADSANRGKAGQPCMKTSAMVQLESAADSTNRHKQEALCKTELLPQRMDAVQAQSGLPMLVLPTGVDAIPIKYPI